MSVDDDTLLAIIAICLKKKENENKKRRTKRLWMKEYCSKERNEFTYENLVDELKDAPKNDFRNFFISDESIYDELLQMVGPLIKKKDTLMRDAIPVGVRLSTSLRFLATGDHFESMKIACGMSPLSISKTVVETCEAIISQLKNYMKAPKTQAEWSAVLNEFKIKCDFPNCLGAVGGKHVAIIKPTGSQSLYFNYKKFFSVELLAVVNADYEFLAAEVDISGKISGEEDFCCTTFASTSFGNSLNKLTPNLFAESERKLPLVFVGSDGFQLTRKFLKPFQENDDLSEDKQVYNYRLSQVQQIIENTFGTLSAIFGVLQKPINLGPEKVKTIVLACCYLYNYLRKKTEPHLWDGYFDKDFEFGMMLKGSWRDFPDLIPLQTPIALTVSSEVEEVRQKFVDYFNIE